MPDKTVRVLLLEDNPGDARLVKEMLAESGPAAFHLQWAETLVAGLERLSRSEFDVALIDLALPDSRGLETLTTVRRHAPQLPVVMLTGFDSDAMALKAVEGGAQDYLVKGKLNGESLARALRHAIVRHGKQVPESGEAAHGTLLGVMGSKGGVGATTFACHYGLELARRKRDSVLLADLDGSSAGAAFLLRCTGQQYSMMDASMNLNKLDAASWKNLVWKHPETLDLIQAPGAVSPGDHLNPDRVRHVLRFVRHLYESLVVDLGRFGPLLQSLLPDLDKLILLTTPALPALYEAKRAVQKLRDLGYEPGRVSVILNRIHAPGALPRLEMEKALGFPICAELSAADADLELTAEANGGLSSNSHLRKQIALAASRIAGDPEESAPKRGGAFFYRLWERPAT